MRSRPIALALVLVSTTGLTGGTARASGAPTCADAATKGCWSAPFSEGASDTPGIVGKYGGARKPETIEEAGDFPTAVSAVVLPTGRILYWDGLSGIQNGPTEIDFGRVATPDRSRLLDLGDDPSDTPLFLTPSPEAGGAPDNMFCADQRLMANGKAIVAGGTRYETMEPRFPTGPDGPAGHVELYGSKNTRLYTENGQNGGDWEWNAARDMAERRWYPTLVTQPDGKLFIAGGVSKLVFNSNALDPRASDAVPKNVRASETYDPATERWSTNGTAGERSLPLFARMHLLPNGEVFFGGDGQQWNPAGEDVDELQWNFHAAYNPATKTWRTLNSPNAMGSYAARSGAFSVLLPLKAPYDQAKVLMGGGTLGVSPGSYVAQKVTEIVTLKEDDSGDNGMGGWRSDSRASPDLNIARWYSSGVVLPNGEVLAINGGDRDDVIRPGSAGAVRTPELWDGTAWTTLAPGARDRVYHNSAVLLPDGSVLIGGHAPINEGNGNANPNNDEMGLNNNLRDPSFERFFPPYLYRGARPELKTAPTAAHNGGSITATIEPGSEPITKMVLTRLPSPTHTTDADARTVEVGFTTAESGVSLTTTALPGASVLPPGYYYLFALSASGVPSIAKIVRVTSS